MFFSLYLSVVILLVLRLRMVITCNDFLKISPHENVFLGVMNGSKEL